MGLGGYIAPRHLKAIKETGNTLVAALDPKDSVGIIDSYFPDCDFFVEFERFDRHVDMLRRKGTNVDYVSICTPNYLHDAHIRFALRQSADAICEKPLVLNPWNVDALASMEAEYQRKVNTILQLRLHPSIVALREEIAAAGDKVFDIDLTYITSRGRWYDYSWKGDLGKSGGVATNIGVHFFDMLTWVFGPVERSQVFVREEHKASGFLRLRRANVRWFMSIDRNDLPERAVAAGKTTYRSISIEGREIGFSDGFTDLHTESYNQILSGNGFGLDDARAAVEIVHAIRNAPLESMGDRHPMIQ